MTGVPIISNPQSFWEEARYQAVCAVCERAGPFHAHHVVSKSWLTQRGLPEYDTRNALRLCCHDPNNCHFNFEWGGVGKVQVLVRHLVQLNLCYVFETMGAGPGIEFLRREYLYEEGTDVRWEQHLTSRCPWCQS
jgi:hypothetical protein